MGPEDQQQVTQWLERDSSVAQAYSLTQEFLKAIHRHEPARLQQWLAEAAVHSLKTVKRQMFGRGKLDLLRKRYLALAERRHWYKRTQQPSSELVQVLSEVP
ncbi:hypothetical protein D2Q93_13275 [Alicyclobacillaceae bacterium I2511]|nr:hypothetical protein D2Q93_13275 [Alicyclobacillaceae bacterium I2511]